MIQAPFRVRYETPENTQTVRNVAKLLTISFFRLQANGQLKETCRACWLRHPVTSDGRGSKLPIVTGRNVSRPRAPTSSK